VSEITGAGAWRRQGAWWHRHAPAPV